MESSLPKAWRGKLGSAQRSRAKQLKQEARMPTAPKGSADKQKARRFARAANHSARVRLLRWLVPVVAIVALTGVAAIMVVSRLTLPGVDVDVAASAIVDGKLVIADPRLDGFTADKRAYRVSAQSASQAIGEDPLTLRMLRADVELEDGSTAFLSADDGVFDPTTNRLMLGENAVLETTTGLRAQFSGAEIDIDGGSFVSRQPVEVSRPGTQIVADGLTIEDSGRRLVFENNVTVVIEPSSITARAETE